MRERPPVVNPFFVVYKTQLKYNKAHPPAVLHPVRLMAYRNRNSPERFKKGPLKMFRTVTSPL